jgi:DNA-binding MarR family transcriptional regulator
MKANQFVDKLLCADEKHGVEPNMLLLLGYIMNEWKAGEVTIMNILLGFERTSQMTTHNNLNRLIQRKILRTKKSKDDGRVKTVEKGTKYDAFITYLEE